MAAQGVGAKVLIQTFAFLFLLFVAVYYVSMASSTRSTDICYALQIDCSESWSFWGKHPEQLLLPTVYKFENEGRCPVYTYFEPTQEAPLEMVKLHRLAQVWRKNWYRAGWKPYVIGEDEARDHPLYQELREKFRLLPTVNDRFYELQCYLRWVAMANLGGGFMSDYDILNYGFPPPPASELSGPCGRGTLTSYESLMPMLVSGDSEAYIHMAKLFANYQVQNDDLDAKGRPHVSDMELTLSRFSHEFEVKPHQDTLIHYSHWYVLDNVGEIQLPRWQIVNKLACFEALSVKKLSAVYLPSFTEGDLIAKNMVERLQKCLVTDRQSAQRNRAKEPYTIVLLPPSPIVTFAVEYLKYVKGTDSVLLQRWFEKSAGLGKQLTFEGFLGSLETSAKSVNDFDGLVLGPLLNGAGVSGSGLSAIDQVAAVEKAISGDRFMVGFLDQVNETLSLLEYEIGYDLDEEDYKALGEWLQHEWGQIHEVVLSLSSRVQKLFETSLPLDTRLLSSMRKHFEIRTRKFAEWTSSSTKPTPYRSRVS
ncbi:hypothetical protein KFL_002090080 [Klebsormidium nitens]|uniref:Uncharacterized protein n=1 Tax=Klebsormidium nitens TaxID=105231 RepID=A0A1Y1I841_KLENI|nr:hypothetical protein KFL_002090080 [Klebsormidium nitens]|eukprot:GAQ84856.1 hypothetical protein KFL_002090080 [Klebsormidium nitens]